MNLDKTVKLVIPYTPKVHQAHLEEIEQFLAKEDLSESVRLRWMRRKRRAETLFKRFSKTKQTGN